VVSIPGFRERLQSFLIEHDQGKPPKDPAGRLAWRKAWCATLADGGYAGPSWPREWGGMELGFADQVVYAEELERARVPSHPGTGVMIAAPTLIRHGSDEQRERWLRPLLRADEVWTQGWSEPEAGSDLPSLRTTARRDGEEYVVEGQKIWCTAADIADRIFALVRTGPPGSAKDGISYLIVDARAPGVEVRPIRDIAGGEHFAEIFFDGVRVPVADRVGPENAGWAIARTSLGHERAAGGFLAASRYARIVGELVEVARQQGRLDDPRVREQLAESESAVRIMRVNAARTIEYVLEHGEPGPASSITRLFNATFEQRLHEVAVELLGLPGVLAPADPNAVERGRWAWGYLRTRASTIGAGTAEIQRNTIAERVLGLPREVSV
jgi:alkylation response protein AidB-like acyl-CoA dehydrogenase